MHPFIRVGTQDLTAEELLGFSKVLEQGIHGETLQDFLKQEMACLKQFWRHKTKPGIIATEVTTYQHGRELFGAANAGMPTDRELWEDFKLLAKSLDCRWAMWAVTNPAMNRLYKMKLKMSPKVWTYFEELDNGDSGQSTSADEGLDGKYPVGDRSES